MKDIERMEPPPGATWTWPVHVTGATSKPPVIVMHEIYGMSPTYTEFCRQLASDRFSVWMPQLVGKAPSMSTGDKARALTAICISREIDVLRSGRTSPVVAKLRSLAQHLSSTHDGGSVGVVGMCLSGGFALAMAADPSIVASVVAQPALPLRPFCGRALGLSGKDVNTIQQRLTDDDVQIYYTRFSDDPISPRSRLTRVVSRLGTNGITVDELRAAEFRLLDHSVLTAAPEHYGEQEPQATRLAETASRVSDFLRARLTQAS